MLLAMVPCHIYMTGGTFEIDQGGIDASAVVILAILAVASPACADIYQWEYINPADPSQGKRQSAVLCQDGFEVYPSAGADLSFLALRNAYLIGAIISGGNFSGTDLSQAEFTSSNLTDSNFGGANCTNANLANADLSGVYFGHAILTGTNLMGAIVKGADFVGNPYAPAPLTSAQLYSTASYQNHDLGRIHLHGDLSGWIFQIRLSPMPTSMGRSWRVRISTVPSSTELLLAASRLFK